MKTLRLLVASVFFFAGLAGAEHLLDALPPDAARQMREMKLPEAVYNNAQLCDVCSHLRWMLSNAAASADAVTNLCLEVAETAVPSNEATRITFKSGNISFAEVLSEVARQARIGIGYTNRCLVVRTFNGVDTAYGSPFPRVAPPAKKTVVISDPASNISVSVRTPWAGEAKNDDVFDVGGDWPTSAIMHLSPRVSESGIRDAKKDRARTGKIPDVEWESIGRVVFRKNGGDGGIATALEKQDGANGWFLYPFDSGRWIVTFDDDASGPDSGAFGPDSGIYVHVNHLHDPGVRLPQGRYRLTITSRLRALQAGGPYDFDVNGKINFRVGPGDSPSVRRDRAWLSLYKACFRSQQLDETEKARIVRNLADIGKRHPAGQDDVIDASLGFLFENVGMDEEAFDRWTAYLKFAQSPLNVVPRIGRLADRLGRKSPAPEIIRYRNSQPKGGRRNCSP
jgi:hypothetical protein